jgi:hypothetical protein
MIPCTLAASHDLLPIDFGADAIDKKTFEIVQDGSTVYTTLQDIADDLPDNSPRYVLLSYPLTLVIILESHIQAGGLC